MLNTVNFWVGVYFGMCIMGCIVMFIAKVTDKYDSED